MERSTRPAFQRRPGPGHPFEPSAGSSTDAGLLRPGDHYRTRLTHARGLPDRAVSPGASLERRADRAIALGHDLGTRRSGTPVSACCSPWSLAVRALRQSLRIVDVLEHNGQGLNLTWEVRDGIARHSKASTASVGAGAPPARRARLPVADIIAYVNHDRRCGARGAAGEDLRASPRRLAQFLPADRHDGHRRRDADARATCPKSDERRRTRGDERPAQLLFEPVYENEVATAGVQEAAGTSAASGRSARRRKVPRSADDRRRGRRRLRRTSSPG